jgi:hypothetical protein
VERIATQFYLTGTAWDEVLKLKTLNSLGLNNVKVNSSGVLFSDRNASGCCITLALDRGFDMVFFNGMANLKIDCSIL